MQRIPIDRPRRSGFTLVELLVAITVLALLASLVLVGLAAAEESARVAKTRTTIAKLNAIVMQKYESYRTRRVPVAARGPNETSQEFARRRLDALRELMRMEMPDAFTDIEDGPVSGIPRPAVSHAYLSALNRAKAAHPTVGQDNQSAECLYLFIIRGSEDPDVLEQFSPSEIGDTDSDSMPEFLDGWGRPITYLRWAPAFESPLQPKPPVDQDPFDPLKVYPNAFPIYPLIYSAGPDGEYDITVDSKGAAIHYKDINNNPFDATVIDFIGLGEQKDSSGNWNSAGNKNQIVEWLDNITNHDGS